MTFHDPSRWALLLLALLPVLWWWRRRRPRRALVFSSVEPLLAVGTTWAVRLRWLVPALRAAALVLLIVCVARPQQADERTRRHAEGIAIQLVVDRSGSMLAEDFELDRRPASRLAVVRTVVEKFVDGGDRLPGRPDDLIGLITFATWVDSVCPMTLDHGHLIESVRQTAVASDEEDRATAIGDAIALGVERMHGLDRRADLMGAERIRSRVMILLTDGESNAGDIDPLTAAQMAASFGIKIYTIGAGTRAARAPMPTVDPFTGRRTTRMVPVSIDEETLEAIAELTGGAYFRATDSDSLESIYARIDEMERTPVEQRRYTSYKELAVQPVRFGRLVVPPLLTVVFGLLTLEIVLATTRLRTIP